ncbi:MAG: hypothetical protein HY854_25865 [Burkholderiales bacterium]|nr:hypothetical protein [Burkholderiales bacterium]
MSRKQNVRPGDADSDEPLSDSEIEAILAEEGAQPPEAGTAAPQPSVHQSERLGKWLAWLLAFFVILGLVQAMR